MNSQGNFSEPNDLKVQQPANECNDSNQSSLSGSNTQDSILEENNQMNDPGDKQTVVQQDFSADKQTVVQQDGLAGKQTVVQQDFLTDKQTVVQQDGLTDLSVDDLSALDELESGDLNLIDSTVDDTNDLLPFINSGNGSSENNLGELSELGAQDLELGEDANLDPLDLNLEVSDIAPNDISGSDDLNLDLDGDSLDLNLEVSDIAPNGISGSDDLNLDFDDSLDSLEGFDSSEMEELSQDNGLELGDLNLGLEDVSATLEMKDLELDDSKDALGEMSLLSELGSLDDLLSGAKASSVSTPVVGKAPVVISKATTSYNRPQKNVPSKVQTFDQTMRVSVRKLDDLNNLIGELVVKRNRLEEDQERIRRFMDNLLNYVQSLGEMGGKMHDLYERSLLEGALMASRNQSQSSSGKKQRSSFLEEDEVEESNELDALELDRFTGFHLLSQDIIELIVRVREAASDIQFVVDETDKVTQSLRQVTSQLQDGMNSSRMMPFGQTTDRLPRAIRDISRKLKKQVKLQIEGKDVLIDKMIVESLYNPMTHLVNNAITHGIETPEERVKLGKPENGTILIRAFLQGNQTVITIADDGAGIDPERIKAKAVEKGMLTWAKAQELTNPETYDLIFHAGFSTKDQADDFAGRGVGMDVVNTDLTKIRGTISIESEVGKGTTFIIRLPLVLSICKAISCVFNNTRIAFPLDGVEAQKEYLPNEIITDPNGVKQISWEGDLLPFQPLSNLLLYNRQLNRGGVYNLNKEDDFISIIILRSADNLMAVQVDQIIGEQEIVIKQIEGPVPKPSGITGATVLGDGVVMPIADVLELIEIAQGKRTIELGFNVWEDNDSKQADELSSEPTVLVVDDSITVRELLTLSFTKLGYRVEQARDGQEGWEKLRGGLPCDMIFCDIEMPRMNGLELLSNLQKDEQLKYIPMAMLTSRGADKHRKLATDLGAKAYLTKPYTEKNLMDVAQNLIEISRAHKEETQKESSRKEKIDRSNNNSAKVKTDPVVLIIDDSVTVRALLSMTFKKAGYQVEQARDGQEALEKLKDGLACDIAFCDIEMPRMNGLELLANLQEDEELSGLPMAMLTSRGAQKMRNIAAQRGAKGYFVKPYVEETLLDAAKRMMDGEVLIDSVNFDDQDME